MIKMVEHALMAASFAEEGEFEAAHSLMRDSRRVLLAVKAGKVDSKTLKYALNTAKRINANLDILYVSASNVGQHRTVDRAFESFKSELTAAGFPYRVISRAGCLKQQIIDYTNKEKEILFAVIESPASFDADCVSRDKELSELWRQLKCPLVVVMDGTRA